MFGIEKMIMSQLNLIVPKLLGMVNKNLHKAKETKKIMIVFDVGKENFENCKIMLVKFDDSIVTKPFDVSKVDFIELTKEKK